MWGSHRSMYDYITAAVHGRRHSAVEWTTGVFQHDDSAAESILSHLSVRLSTKSDAISVVDEPRLHGVEVRSHQPAGMMPERAIRRRSDDVGEPWRSVWSARWGCIVFRRAHDDERLWSDNVRRGQSLPAVPLLSIVTTWVNYQQTSCPRRRQWRRVLGKRFREFPLALSYCIA